MLQNSIHNNDILSIIIMNTADKHFKFINSKTGYVIFYSSISASLTPEEQKAELDKIKAQVAIKNGLYHGTVYWEEIKDE